MTRLRIVVFSSPAPSRGVACGPGRCRLGAFPGGGPSADNDRPVYRVGRGNGGFAQVRRVRTCGVCGGYRRGRVRVLCGSARWERGVASHTFHRPPTLVGRRSARRSSELRPVGCAVHRGTRPVYVRSATGTTRGPSSYGPNCTALTGSECSAAGWLAFGIPSACALTCVRLVPECVWSPSLASRARLLALYPGCGLRELAEVAGRRGPGGRGFLAHSVAAGGAVVLGDLWAAA